MTVVPRKPSVHAGVTVLTLLLGTLLVVAGVGTPLRRHLKEDTVSQGGAGQGGVGVCSPDTRQKGEAQPVSVEGGCNCQHAMGYNVAEPLHF